MIKMKTIIQAVCLDSQGVILQYKQFTSMTIQDLDELQDYVRARITQPEVADIQIRKREYKL